MSSSDDFKPMLCDECGQQFKKRIALLSHYKWKHENLKILKCSTCEKDFTRKSRLKKHEKICSIKEKNIKCVLCNFKGLKRDDVVNHYETGHQYNFEKKTLTFKTMEDFLCWKQDFENETKSNFIKSTRTRHTNVGMITKYVCHRDGVFKIKGKGIRHIKSGGSNKINGHCPANIVTYATDEIVKVDYMPTHVGHSFELCKLNIAKSDKDVIAQKLSQKIPFENILDEIRDSVINNSPERIHLITRKDLWNIADSYNLNYEAKTNKNDFISVQAWITHMQKASNIVRFYKGQGELLKEYPQLQKEDFFLVIMNDAQQNMLQKFGNDCICIDSIHGPDSYDFQVYTLMVLDDIRQGFPCCFLFSNRGDTIAMKIFFKVLKDLYLKDSPIKPKTFMSDTDDSFYNAWSAVMGQVENRLFCSWHVDKAWRENLNKIINKEKQAIVYEKIKILMYEMEEESFNLMATSLLSELCSDPDCFKFEEYFETYMNICSRWAYCFRKECDINANMFLESMHNVLKHIYFGGKKVKRLDKAITMLLKFIKDKFFDRQAVVNTEKNSKKISYIRQSHKKSVELKSCILDLGDCWHVSSTNNNDIYIVRKLQTNCTCKLRCLECRSCIHDYSCTCIDYAIKWNMCQHIHLVCTSVKSNPVPAEENISTNLFIQDNDCFDVDNVSDISFEENPYLSLVEHTRKESFEKRKQDLIENFIKIVSTIENEQQLEAVKKQVAPIQSIISTLSKKDMPNIAHIASVEPPNKKLKLQQSLYNHNYHE